MTNLILPGMAWLEATPTIDTSAYASGDLIGTKMSFGLGDTWGNARAGEIRSVLVADNAKQDAQLDVLFWDTDPSNTTFTDNAALTVADADLVNLFGVAEIFTWKDFNDNSVGIAQNLTIPLVFPSGTKTLYAAIVSRGTPTYAADDDLTVRVGIVRAR